ncbi:phosphate transport system permease protein [Vibrio xiamenensis]|uniref:Phosphate transport system permease protein n=1 Tax=Vibrio xiamenensis TaxID=861298 RepID=A0A1G7W499_9VIBR|nr:ABC transporter permease subunit [Vibrio xiamenensis]SDG66814.1 phosphate transport system permease protein [Vibrio xiamenensis]
MAQANFSLQEKDRKRLIKDRLVRIAVSMGGVGVLGALLLIFIYLIIMVLPLFGDASLTPSQAKRAISTSAPVAIGVDDYGENAFVISPQGEVQFWPLTGVASTPLKTQQIPGSHDLFSQTPAAQGWYGFASKQGDVQLFHPRLSSVIHQQSRQFSPSVEQLTPPQAMSMQVAGRTLEKFVFALNNGQLTFAAWYDDQRVRLKWQDQSQDFHSFSFESPIALLKQLLITPDGLTLYALSGSDLVVAKRVADRYQVREVVDLSRGNGEHNVSNISLLAGAYSLLVTYSDGLVAQWFDVLKHGERKLTQIREFSLASNIQLLLPDTYRKGFYTFYSNGTVQSHYTTSEKLVIFKRAYQKAPDIAAMSSNEEYLLTFSDSKLNVAYIDNPFPEVSLSSLWQKVWYEGYPEPEYVWQTSSASEQFEAKFSIVPIAFGTFKAALFAMLFAVPIAVLGAIYTAYFMNPKMRRVVKPSIELMEALPTVIIGFLAGLWFAPFVENHLSAVVALLLLLPLSTIVIGGIWRLLPNAWLNRLPRGWHAAVLMPVILIMTALIVIHSGDIEYAFFSGDVRVFLAEHGINFDQRNALVVGFAMGFAVIPTIFTIAEDAIFSVPKHLSDGSLALGATPWQTLTRVVLLTASPGIFSAIMMGLGRAVGETMIVLMATGNTPIMDWNILEGMRTLSATIAVEMPESEVGSSHFRILFFAALLLLMFTFAVNSLAEWVRQRLREKYRAL